MFSRCHLYRLRSIHALANRIGRRLDRLQSLATEKPYRVYKLRSTGRIVEEPSQELQSLHRQFHRYFTKIQTPNYLYSSVKGKSYVMNAQRHVNDYNLIKIDIKSFYPSTSKKRIFHFFNKDLQCARDVSGLLADLVSFNGHLPTGSSVSPMLSFLCYRDMFDAIYRVAEESGATMTCYVDYIVLSGPGVNRNMMHSLVGIIMKYGLRAHKLKFYEHDRSKMVTGVVVTSKGISLPYSRWRKIKNDLKCVASTPEGPELDAALTRAISRLNEAGQIETKCIRMAGALVQKRRRIAHIAGS